jgi:hypothetical protein
MYPRPAIEAVSVVDRAAVQNASRAVRPDMPALNELALRSLAVLFSDEEKLFARRITWTDGGFRQEGTSVRGTVIALLGLQRVAMSRAKHVVDVDSIGDAVLRDTSWVTGVGDLGLLTWFTAEWAPERLKKLISEFDFWNALDTYRDGHEARTEGLAWFLSGIAHARIASPTTIPDLTDVAVEAYHLLENNQSEGGIFGNKAFPRFPHQASHKRLGTFADQMYAVYALTAFARAFQVEEPLTSALSCANAVRALQGEQGQWWFLYNKRACRVAKRYPVLFSHQYGIAPLAFLALEELTGQSFRSAVEKGISWFGAANELGEDLRNLVRGLIWDSIEQKKWPTKCWEAALDFLNVCYEPHLEKLRIRYEARPDQFGWLLYVFGGLGLPQGADPLPVPA